MELDKEKSEILKNVEKFVREKLKDEPTGHDYYHAKRVMNTALKIQEEEGGDKFIISISALLHDIADEKTFGEKEGNEMIRNLLKSNGLEEEVINKILDIIGSVSFKKGKVPKSKEGKIVQDADRLDALGAIGIARTFAYGGKNNRLIYDPENVKKTTIGHFYEKLFKLKDLMNTKKGKEIAEKREKIMREFLKNFFDEWEGRDL